VAHSGGAALAKLYRQSQPGPLNGTQSHPGLPLNGGVWMHCLLVASLLLPRLACALFRCDIDVELHGSVLNSTTALPPHPQMNNRIADYRTHVRDHGLDRVRERGGLHMTGLQAQGGYAEVCQQAFYLQQASHAT
jgi:hypothetical protein